MPKKPARVFQSRSAEPKKHIRLPVYEESSDSDRNSITQEVMDCPVDHTAKPANSYGALLHCIYDAVLITDTAGTILEANARAEQVLGYLSENMMGANAVDIISGADQALLDTLRENINDRQYTLLEAVCIRADQSRFHAEIIVNQMSVEDELRLCFFVRDITDRKESERRLEEASGKLLEAERLQSRLATLATLYHELNNPMQIMMCMAELDGNPEYRTQLSRIISIMEQLRTEEPLHAVVDEKGVSRFELNEQESTEDCNPQRLLVADDEDILRQMFVAAISQSMPYLQIDAVPDGERAVELYKAHHHSLVIMDVAMPGISGEEAFAEIQAFSTASKWKSPRFIFCTGFLVSENLRMLIGDQSVHTCLKKPLSISDLILAVKSRLAGGPGN